MHQNENIERIIDLHTQLLSYGRKSLAVAIEVGQLLSEQKRTLQHGQWTAWIGEHLPFGARTASTYMRLFAMKDLLKSENISDLGRAQQLMTRVSVTRSRDSVSAIQAKLELMSVELPPLVTMLEEHGENAIAESRFETFEDYLRDLGMTSDQWQHQKAISAALCRYVEGGSAVDVLDLLIQVPLGETLSTLETIPENQ